LLNQHTDPSEPATKRDLPFAEGDDLLWRQLKSLPAFRALLRSVEARFYHQLTLSGPILDVGCGDGHFAQMAFDCQISTGIDPWQGPLNKAKDNHVYKHSIQGYGDSMPFPDGYFANAISNSVLEHIPIVQPVLGEINRVLEIDGRLVITMPNDQFTKKLGGALFFERLGMRRAADSYRHFFNRISRHAHTDSAEIWATRLATSGFVVERWQNYFSVLAPWKSSLRFTERWLRPYYEETAPESGVMTLIVARKVSTNPVSATVPPASVLTYQEPAIVQVVEPAGEYTELTLPQDELIEATSAEIEGDPPQDSIPWTASPRTTLILLLVCLGGIFIGQSVLRNSAGFQSAALPWFGLSLLALLLLVTRTNRQQSEMLDPANGPWTLHISQKQWLLLPALIFVLIADRLTTNASSTQATILGLFIWGWAIVLTIYCLWDGMPSRFNAETMFSGPRWEPFAVLVLFLVSLALRFGYLTGHPYILSGSEASIGLDAAAVASGHLRDPFAAGWLSNPTMTAFLMALPIKLIGQTILATRVLSPLIGSVTVVATYLVGRMFWGPLAGIIAALLLAGSHVHIHYSRIGLTNIWDPFILLLTMGLIYLAWTRKQRFIWLIAGLFVGFNAYFYTTSHLIPVILLGFVMVMFTRGSELRDNRRHILAAAILALIVALPQLLFYQSNSDVFFDRYRTLGVLQGNWLIEEVARSGESVAGILTKQFAQGLLAYNFGADLSNSYSPGIPLLSFFPSVLLLLGLGLALVRIKRLKSALLIVVFLSTVLVAGVLLIEPPSSHRLLIALPIIFLLITAALLWLADKLIDATNISSKYVAPTLIGIVLLISITDVTFYFGRYRAEASYGDRNTEIAHRISDYLNTLDGQWDGYFFAPPSMYANFPTFAYLVEGWQTKITLSDIAEDDSPPLTDIDHNNVFLYLPERADEIERMSQHYRNGRLLTFPGSNADPLFYAFEVPADVES